MMNGMTEPEIFVILLFQSAWTHIQNVILLVLPTQIFIHLIIPSPPGIKVVKSNFTCNGLSLNRLPIII